MAEGPELNERTWVRISQRHLPEQLEGLLGSRLRIGDDAMDSLLAINVGFVLMHAAEAINDGLAEERQHREHQHEDPRRRPVVLRGPPPLVPITANQPLHTAIPKVELDQQKN